MFGENPMIHSAIRETRCLQFIYDNEVRLVEPHCHGEDQDGDSSLRAYQICGGCSGWRMFHVSRLEFVVTVGQQFETSRSGYRRNDRGTRRIFAQL